MIRNISFTSAMVVKGLPKEIRGIDMRMNREAWTIEQNDFLTHTNPNWPSSQHISGFNLSEDLYYANVTGEYPSSNLEIGLPKEKFAYGMTKIKDGATASDSVYLFVTGNDAKLLDRINISREIEERKLNRLKVQLAKIRDKTSINTILDEINNLELHCGQLTAVFEKFIAKHSVAVPIEAKKVLRAISKKHFGFEELSLVKRSVLYRG